MHSMMEGEGGSEPQDVFVELGTLIVEGRVPGGGNPRGYCEGPHCVPQGLNHAALRHHCNSLQNFLCKRAENFRKHMLFMFQNNLPMCIEVFLCSDCPCGAQKAQSPEVGIVPSASDLLLEQWTITCLSRLNEPAPMLVRGLMQAVRSQLHFSQLSAWWSSSKGVCPSHVSYRVTVPGQSFVSQFSRQPNEHTFPLASVGKNGAIKVCARSLPRMESAPAIHCPLHSSCLPAPSMEVGEKPCLSKPFLPGCSSNLETASGSSVVSPCGLDGAGDSSLGESLLNPPQRFRSPPRAAEAPDRFLFRRLPTEVVGARWQGDTPPSPPLGLPGRWWMRDSPCMSSKLAGQTCPRAAASKSRRQPGEQGQEKLCGFSGLFDDRMQMKCTMSGKHHCSCEVEEELEEVKAPAQVRQRRRSQASLPPHSTSGTTDAPDVVYNPSYNASEGVANESTKRSSGLAVMADEYLYTSDGLSGNGGNTGSLKRRRPVLDSAEASCSAFQGKSWVDLDSDHDLAMSTSTASGISCSSLGLQGVGTGGASPFGASPSKGSTAPIQLQPPLSKHELEEVLAVLRDRNKPNNRSNFQTQQVFFASASDSPARIKDMVDSGSEASDLCYSLFRPTLPAETDAKSSKSNSVVGAVMPSMAKCCPHNTVHQYPCHYCKREKDECARTKSTGKEESYCDKNWSDMKRISSVKTSAKPNVHSSCIVNGKKPSLDLSEEYNNQVICDKHTSLLKCDIGDSYLCLSCVSETLSSQTKEENQPQAAENILGSGFQNSNSPLSLHLARARSRRDNCSSTSLAVKCVTQELQKDFHNGCNSRQDVPSASERERFRRSFDSAASMVFHTRTGLPLTSSPAPVRRGTSHFDYDSSINSVHAIKSALFDTPAIATQMEDSLNLSSDAESEGSARSPCSPDAGMAFPSLGPCHALSPCSSLLGSFEESVLNGRLEPVSTVQGFTAEIGASGSFCPRHLKLPVTVFFYTLGDYDKVSTPYLGHINLGKKGYNVPRSGTIQVTLFNPMETVIKMFVVMYDLNDMPPNSHTFLRQRTLYMPAGTEIADDLPESDVTQKWLRYLIHLRFSSSKSGRVYLHTDIRMIIFRKSDMDTATVHNNNNVDSGFELRSYTYGPGNPKFSPR